MVGARTATSIPKRGVAAGAPGLFSSLAGSIAEGGAGYSCIAEQRTVETIRDGGPRTPFLRFGDRVRIEMRDGAGRSIFGAIEQTVRKG